MPDAVLLFVIVVVVLGMWVFISAMREPSSVWDDRATVTNVYTPNYDYSRDRLTDFAKMVSCAKAINTVNGQRILFDVYVVKDGVYEPQVEVRLRHKSEEREWLDIEFVLEGYSLAAIEPFKTFRHSTNTGTFTNHQAVRCIRDYEERRARGLEWTGRKSNAESYERKITCDRS